MILSTALYKKKNKKFSSSAGRIVNFCNHFVCNHVEISSYSRKRHSAQRFEMNRKGDRQKSHLQFLIVCNEPFFFFSMRHLFADNLLGWRVFEQLVHTYNCALLIKWVLMIAGSRRDLLYEDRSEKCWYETKNKTITFLLKIAFIFLRSFPK